jgi:hypothetical protein
MKRRDRFETTSIGEDRILVGSHDAAPAPNGCASWEGIMDTRQTWEELAAALGYEFRPGVRALLDSPLTRIVSEAQGINDVEKAPAILGNPLLMSMLDKVFLGMASGTHRAHQVFLYRQARSSGESGRTRYESHLHLLFVPPLELGLRVYREGFWSKVGKTIFRTQDIQTGHRDLDDRVMIKGSQVKGVGDLLSSQATQNTLLALFDHSSDFRVDDHGIRYVEPRECFEAESVRAALEVMADAADSLMAGHGS